MKTIMKKMKLRNDFLTGVVSELAKRRMELGYTQEELNAEIGVADRLLGKWETGMRTPTSFNLYCWADSLDMKLTVVANDNSPVTPAPAMPVPYPYQEAANDNRFTVVK